MSTYLDAFKASVEAYLTKHSISASAFGRAAAGDPNLVSDLRAGREPRFSTIERVEKWMKEQKNPPQEAA